MIGKIISHYKILLKLGEGGMGIVYKAQDTKLDRTVALKFLPSHLTKNETDLKRFVQEAKAAAALNHPNVCTIHEIHDEGENPFIVMEYVEGRTLRDVIHTHLGPPSRGEKVVSPPLKGDLGGCKELSLNDTIDIAIQIAEALKAAHAKGIIHRDIKCENIMVTDDGRVKVMDFGLARIRGSVKLTKTGTTTGTAAYMSPEQFQNREIDHRTDIWSFGVVLYEMTTGCLPFEGDYEAAVMYAVVNEEAKSVRRFREDVPQHIEKMIHKCLEKNADNRYQNLNEVLEDIKKPVPISVSEKVKKSIAVLPFENMSADAEQEYFCDGMTEEIINALTHIENLKVIARTSAFMFKGKHEDIREIGRKLDVANLLEGSVRRAGNKLRITAQLIKVDDGSHLWSEKYDGTLDDIFDIQEKVARSIVDEIKLKLTPEEDAKISKRDIENIQAYEYYLKARHEIYTVTKQRLDNALRDLTKGLELVGDNVLLYASMGHVYYQYWNTGAWPDKTNLRKVEEYANLIFKLEPDSKHGHFLMGLYYLFMNPPKALNHFNKVLSKDPYHAETLLWLSVYLVFQGKEKQAQLILDRVYKIDPLNPIVKILPGNLYCHCGRLEAALETLKEVYHSDSTHFMAQFHYARALIYANRIAEALALIDNLGKKFKNNMMAQLFQLYKYALQGKKSELIQFQTQEFLTWVQRDWMYSIWLTEIFALIDENDKVLDWLSNAIDLGYINYPFLNESNPLLKNIRGEEEFQNLMKKIKPKWENFKL